MGGPLHSATAEVPDGLHGVHPARYRDHQPDLEDDGDLQHRQV